MTSYILRLEEITPKNNALVGGKAANLAVLIQDGLPVPPGFCVTTDAYRQFISAAGLSEKIKGLISDGRYDEIANLINQSQIPSEISEDIINACRRLNSRFLAVRSSATAEDLPDASFAGQHDTFLGVTEDNLLKSVKKCWASLWNDRAVAYRNSKKIGHLKVLMAVVVQEMIRSDVSGVMFTVNPMNRSDDQMVIESCWGFGEAIVSGVIVPDNYIVSKDDKKIVSKTLGRKVKMVVFKKGNMKTKKTPWLKRVKFSLNYKTVISLCNFGLKIENLFCTAQDIEWCLSNHEIFILQARSITTLRNTCFRQDKKYIVRRSKVQAFASSIR